MYKNELILKNTFLITSLYSGGAMPMAPPAKYGLKF
jgi:hypothetical protein